MYLFETARAVHSLQCSSWFQRVRVSISIRLWRSYSPKSEYCFVTPPAAPLISNLCVSILQTRVFNIVDETLSDGFFHGVKFRSLLLRVLILFLGLPGTGLIIIILNDVLEAEAESSPLRIIPISVDDNV